MIKKGYGTYTALAIAILTILGKAITDLTQEEIDGAIEQVSKLSGLLENAYYVIIAIAVGYLRRANTTTEETIVKKVETEGAK